MARRLRILAATVAGLAAAAGAPAQAAIPPTPIPEGPGANQLPQFIGSPATPNPVFAPAIPQNPFMAQNGKSNVHDDAYMSDTYTWSGPLGRHMDRASTFQAAECGTLTFDHAGRIVAICVGLEGPRLVMFDPQTLSLLAAFPLPPRQPGGGNPFTDFSGGGYFYLDDRDRAVIPTTTREIWIVRETTSPAGPGLVLDRAYDLNGTVAPDDKVISALPDWHGLIWFASTKGVVGTVNPDTGAVKSLNTGEAIGNSFATDESGGVYIVTDEKMYRFEAASDGSPQVSWSDVYPNTHEQKPGQTEHGSGTTPTVMGSQYVSITDNADPMDIVVYKRAKSITGSRVVCIQPVFQQGASATDNSLIGTDTAMVVENNYGYSGPGATENGKTTTGGLERVDVDRATGACHRVWHSDERAPSVVPKLSLNNGLVYTYTKDPRSDGQDPWYLTALDFRSGRTVWKRIAGEGLGYNNNYAPVTLGSNSYAYVGVLGGLVRLRDRGHGGGGGGD